jgi:hypothetical protein
MRAAALVLFAAGSGCVHVNRDADGHFESVSVSAPHAKAKPATDVIVDPNVQQAAATVPAPDTASISKLAKYVGKAVPRGAASDFALTWQNQVKQLPDPVRNGAMGYGVAGQMFLFAPGFKPVDAHGTLTVEVYDNTNKTNDETGPLIRSYAIHKEQLKVMVAMDERWGKSYTLFLPWPEYKPSVSRLKIVARFEQENHITLYHPASYVTLDTGYKSPISKQSQILPGPLGGNSANSAGFMAPPSNFPGLPANAAPASLPPLDPLPIGGRSATAAPSTSNAGIPAGLPPLVYTIPRR